MACSPTRRRGRRAFERRSLCAIGPSPTKGHQKWPCRPPKTRIHRSPASQGMAVPSVASLGEKWSAQDRGEEKPQARFQFSWISLGRRSASIWKKRDCRRAQRGCRAPPRLQSISPWRRYPEASRPAPTATRLPHPAHSPPFGARPGSAAPPDGAGAPPPCRPRGRP